MSIVVDLTLAHSETAGANFSRASSFLQYHPTVGSRINIILVLFAVALIPACDERIEPGQQPADAADDDAMMCMGTAAPLASCTTSADCESCVCKLFVHSNLCSKRCTLPEDCPAPFAGCTQGFCSPPP